MGRAQTSDSEGFLGQQRELAQGVFEPRLQQAGLSVAQIGALDLEGLRDALERVNDAIAHPEQFGVVRLKFTAEARVVMTKQSADAHIELGVIPILLERKKLILDRTRELVGVAGVASLRDLVDRVPEPDLRSSFASQLLHLEAETERLRAEAATTKLASEEADKRILLEFEQKRFDLEKLERRSAVWRSFLGRESVATVLGAFLLVGLVAALIVATFTGTTVPELVSNAFLIILGYFFGQSSSRRE